MFCAKPLVKFERLLKTYLAFAPTGLQSFLAAMPVWMKEKRFLKSLLENEFFKHEKGMKKKELPPMLFSEGHESHAVSAFCPSPTILRWFFKWKNSVSRRQSLRDWGQAIGSPFVGNFFSPLAWPPILSVHVLHRIEGQFRRVQRHGSRTLRRAKICESNTRTSDQCEASRHVSVEHGVLQLLYRPHDDGAKVRRGVRWPTVHTRIKIESARNGFCALIQEVNGDVMLRLGRTFQHEIGEKNLCLAGRVALDCVGNG